MARALAVAAVALLAGVGVVVVAFAVGRDAAPPAVAVQSGGGLYRGSEPPGVNRLPEFRLRHYDGRVVRSQGLRGKIVLVTFLDSQCDETCPILASRIADGLDRLDARERREVIAVAISTDPAEDTPESVRAFLEKQGALGELLYLTGPQDEMQALWKRFGILSSHSSGEDTLHSAPLRVYDRSLVWVATLHVGADLTPQNLVHDVRVALKKGNDR